MSNPSEDKTAALRKQLFKEILKINVYDDTEIDEDEARLATNRILQALATYLEGADILPEKRTHTEGMGGISGDGKPLPSKSWQVANTVDELSYNQAVKDTAANLAALIAELKGGKL